MPSCLFDGKVNDVFKHYYFIFITIQREGDGMNKFCHECGKEASQAQNNCIHCGTSLQQESVKNEPKQVVIRKAKKTPKKKVPKKQKVMISVTAVILLLTISFIVWGNHYQSAKAVEKRFEVALVNSDNKQLTKLMIHEDGSGVNEQEAQAFLALTEEDHDGITTLLTSVIEHGKFLGLFTAHKIEVVDQFVFYDDLVEGLTFLFNDAEIPVIEQEDRRIVYGPLAPGIYDVQAVFEGEYGETTMDDSLTVSDEYSEQISIGMEVPVSTIHIFIENYESFDPDQAYIKLNDEEIPISNEGETDEIGPFIIDSSQEVQVVIDMPWGKVTSEPVMIDDIELSIQADLISGENYDELLSTLVDFGEEYFESIATQDVSLLSGVSEEVEKDVTQFIKELTDSESNLSYFYTGKLQAIGVDKSSITVEEDSDQLLLYIDTVFETEGDFHEPAIDPNLEDHDYYWNMGFSFDAKEAKWSLHAMESLSNSQKFSKTDELKGANELYSPSKEAMAEAEKNTTEPAMKEFIDDYTEASVDAINERDFSIVSSYITEDGPRRAEARDYIDYLDSKDIYEEWYGSAIEKVEKTDDTTWTVTVIEEFDIQRPDSSAVKKFRTVLIVKQIDGELYVDKLVETNEL